MATLVVMNSGEEQDVPFTVAPCGHIVNILHISMDTWKVNITEHVYSLSSY